MSTSLILPVFNGSKLLKDCFYSILKQSDFPDEMIIVDDASIDNSYEVIKKYSKKLPFKSQIIRHKTNLGLAKSYNAGINAALGDVIITMHQDAILYDNAVFKTLIEVFKDKKVVGTTHNEFLDFVKWKEYPFWLKALTSRHIGKVGNGTNGKCDAFLKNAVIAVGGFDGDTFRSAGEDGDLVHKLRSLGKIVKTEANVVHVHDHNFSFKDYLYKHAQFAEAQGVHLRKGSIQSFKELILITFREVLLLLSLIPYTRDFGVILILLYAFLYTKKLYQIEFKNIRIILVPFINTYLLFIDAFYLLKGFITEKQRL